MFISFFDVGSRRRNPFCDRTQARWSRHSPEPRSAFHRYGASRQCGLTTGDYSRSIPRMPPGVRSPATCSIVISRPMHRIGGARAAEGRDGPCRQCGWEACPGARPPHCWAEVATAVGRHAREAADTDPAPGRVRAINAARPPGLSMRGEADHGDGSRGIPYGVPASMSTRWPITMNLRCLSDSRQL